VGNLIDLILILDISWRIERWNLFVECWVAYPCDWGCPFLATSNALINYRNGMMK